ncbi:hypothetical protein ACFO5T_04440 [Dokdonia genika]|uniref:Response regulatory domain-containing protein n=1 Tax=Dokdonia genika TaxID=308113 RepID=A0ABV9L7J3_9FLAO
MNILIVDDNNDKIAKIVNVIKAVSEKFNIDTVIDSVSAQIQLKQIKYDLLILDLLLPIRPNQEPVPNGGELLLREITRNNTLKTPTIIVGITQFEEYKSNFSSIWKLLFFNDSKWITDLTEIIEHTERSIRFTSDLYKEKKTTIIVEGPSDAIIIKEAIQLFKPEFINEVEIKSQRSAGASWVANQIVVWANSLNKDYDGKLIKSIGLLDGDQAGINAITEINRVVKPDSAGASSFKIFKLRPDYAKNTIPIFQKGLIIPITLEELYPPELWKYAETKDWLEERNKMDELLKDPKSWNKWEETLKDYINRIGLSEDELIYLKTFKLSAKEKVVKHILDMDIKEKTKTLQNFHKLISEMIEYLKK